MRNKRALADAIIEALENKEKNAAMRRAARELIVREYAAEKLYDELRAAGIDVLFDDRDARPGVMFADIELIGIPHRVVIGERGLAAGEVEYRGRKDSENQMLPLDGFVEFIRAKIDAEIA